MGIGYRTIRFIDPDTRFVLKDCPVIDLKKWSSKQGLLTLEFEDGAPVVVATSESDNISDLLAGYAQLHRQRREDSINAAVKVIDESLQTAAAPSTKEENFDLFRLAEQLRVKQSLLAEPARLIVGLFQPGSADPGTAGTYAGELANAAGVLLSIAQRASAGRMENDTPLLDAARVVAGAVKGLLLAALTVSAAIGSAEENDLLLGAHKALKAVCSKLDDLVEKTLKTEPSSIPMDEKADPFKEVGSTLVLASQKAGTDTANLLTAAQVAASSITGTKEEATLVEAVHTASESLKRLGDATLPAQSRLDINLLVKLAEEAKALGPALFGLVNSAKRAVPKMSDVEKRNSLVLAANGAGASVKALFESVSPVLDLARFAEIEEALKSFGSIGAMVESLLILVETSGLKADEVAREQALEQLNVGAKALATASKDIFILKGQLGSTTKRVVNAILVTVDASISLARNTASRAAQKYILTSAKHLNVEGTKLAKAARAVVENPSNPDLFNVVNLASKDTAEALNVLIHAAAQVTAEMIDEMASTERRTADSAAGAMNFALKWVEKALLKSKEPPVAMEKTIWSFEQSLEQVLFEQNLLQEAVSRLVDSILSPGKTSLGEASGEVAAKAALLLSAAQAASLGSPSNDMPLVQGARAVVEVVKTLLLAAIAAAETQSERARCDLKKEKERLRKALKLLEIAHSAEADVSSCQLQLEIANTVVAAINRLCSLAARDVSRLPPSSRQKLIEASLAAKDCEQKILGTVALASLVVSADSVGLVEQAKLETVLATAVLALGSETNLHLERASSFVNSALSRLLQAVMASENKIGTQKHFADVARKFRWGLARVSDSGPGPALEVVKSSLPGLIRVAKESLPGLRAAGGSPHVKVLLAAAQELANGVKEYNGFGGSQGLLEKIRVLAEVISLADPYAACRSRAREAAAVLARLQAATLQREDLGEVSLQAGEVLDSMLQTLTALAEQRENATAHEQLRDSTLDFCRTGCRLLDELRLRTSEPPFPCEEMKAELEEIMANVPTLAIPRAPQSSEPTLGLESALVRATKGLRELTVAGPTTVLHYKDVVNCCMALVSASDFASTGKIPDKKAVTKVAESLEQLLSAVRAAVANDGATTEGFHIKTLIASLVKSAHVPLSLEVRKSLVATLKEIMARTTRLVAKVKPASSESKELSSLAQELKPGLTRFTNAFKAHFDGQAGAAFEARALDYTKLVDRLLLACNQVGYHPDTLSREGGVLVNHAKTLGEAVIQLIEAFQSNSEKVLVALSLLKTSANTLSETCHLYHTQLTPPTKTAPPANQTTKPELSEASALPLRAADVAKTEVAEAKRSSRPGTPDLAPHPPSTPTSEELSVSVDQTRIELEAKWRQDYRSMLNSVVPVWKLPAVVNSALEAEVPPEKVQELDNDVLVDWGLTPAQISLLRKKFVKQSAQDGLLQKGKDEAVKALSTILVSIVTADQMEALTTQAYNAKVWQWSQFRMLSDATLLRWGLTVTQIELVRSMDVLEELDWQIEVTGPPLATGSAGLVYRGEYQGKSVALKVGIREDANSRKLILEEAKLSVEISSRCTHTVKTFGQKIQVISGERRLAMVMELVGASVEEKRSELIRTNSCNFAWRKRMATDMLRAVIELHNHNYLHRDLALRNFLLSEDGDAKLADFGLSCRADYCWKVQAKPHRLTAIEAQPEDAQWSKQSDVWSVGLLLWDLFNDAPGTNLFADVSDFNLNAEIRNIAAHHPRPRALSDLFYQPNEREGLAQMLNLFENMIEISQGQIEISDNEEI